MTDVEPRQRQSWHAHCLDAPIVFGRSGSFLVGEGPAQSIVFERGDDAGLADALTDRLEASRSAATATPVAFGALGFRRDTPATFLHPDRVRRLSRSDLAQVLTGRTHVEAPKRILVTHESPTREVYAERVREALTRIADTGSLRKVVLGRWIDVVCDPAVSEPELLSAMLDLADHAHLFGLPRIDPRQGSTASLVGISPELLISRRGRTISSLPLAGSIPRAGDPDEDRRRGEGLLQSGKDHREHALVVEALADSLSPWCETLSISPRPELVTTDTMWHLATRVDGRLRGRTGPSAARLAQLLHPTPAVCGTPTDQAYDTIAELEDTGRGLLAGAVGWVDAEGDGEFAVTIRSAMVDGTSLRLFAGAGIVAGSDPEAEALETHTKLQTMLKVVESL